MNILNKPAWYALIICFCFIILNNDAFPIDMENIVAYPVPFNPKIHNNIRIGYKPGIAYTGTADRVKIEIYDINGDKVFTREYTSINILWNGRNSKGKLVKPGLYLIKISLEDTGTGDYGRKTIRILISK